MRRASGTDPDMCMWTVDVCLPKQGKEIGDGRRKQGMWVWSHYVWHACETGEGNGEQASGTQVLWLGAGSGRDGSRVTS